MTRSMTNPGLHNAFALPSSVIGRCWDKSAVRERVMKVEWHHSGRYLGNVG